jgi:hypothetical protein
VRRDASTRARLVRLSESLPADAALRDWMDRFLDYMRTKRGMADALRVAIASGADPFAQSRARMVAATAELLDAGAAAGTIRDDVQPEDVMASLSGISLAADAPEQQEQAERLLDLLMDGLRRSRASAGG